MKKLLLILLCLPIIGFGQNQSVQINARGTQMQAAALKNFSDQKKLEGMRYLGSGEHKIIVIGSTGFHSIKKLKKNAILKIEEFTEKQNASYEITSVQEFKFAFGTALPQVDITFKVFDQNGELILNKKDREEAVKELKSLKELLDLGLISKEEFDSKAVKLKKIILE